MELPQLLTIFNDICSIPSLNRQVEYICRSLRTLLNMLSDRVVLTQDLAQACAISMKTEVFLVFEERGTLSFLCFKLLKQSVRLIRSRKQKMDN